MQMLRRHFTLAPGGEYAIEVDPRTETNAETNEESIRAIPFMKGYTVFNVEQIDGLPAQYTAPGSPRLRCLKRSQYASHRYQYCGG